LVAQAIAQGFGPSITDPAVLRRFGALLLPVTRGRVAA